MSKMLRQIGIGLLLTSGAMARAAPADPWWNEAWPYRVEVTAPGSGFVTGSVNFTAAFTALGLNQALLDVRSLRVVPAGAAAPVPYTETYSILLDDAENPQFGGGAVSWRVNDGTATADRTRASKGAGSVKAVVQNLVGGYGYPGVELHISGSDPRSDWSRFETFLYDVWPEVNASALDQAPDLYSFKLYDACDGGSVTQGGPPLALGRWNPVSVSLRPFHDCRVSDGLDLSDITRMEFHTRDNDTVNGNSGLWDDGDVMTLWFDELRLLDQDSGALVWRAVAGATRYFVYFDTLRHEGHPLPALDHWLGAPNITGTVGAVEAGGYLHRVAGATGLAGLQIWTAPSLEKVLPTMSAPVATAPLRIAAARGEFEAFQLVVRSSGAQALNVTASTLSNGSRTIPAPRVHRVDYVNITTAGDHFDRNGLWPDPLWPLNNGESVSLTAGQNQPLWFTVQAPWDAPAGVYTGSVAIGAASVPFELEVWDFTLPRAMHLQSEWGFDWSSIVDLYRGVIGGSVQPCYFDLVEAFKRDFAEHRLTPKGVPWPAGLNFPGGLEYDCNGDLDPVSGGMFGFAYLGGRYVHGEGGFNGGAGFPSFLALGPRDNYPPDSLPYSFCGVDRNGVLGSSAFQNEWRQYLAALDAYIVSAGYADSAYYHIVNEPQTDGDYTISGQISAFTQNAAPHLRQLLSEQVEPAVYNHPGAKIDIWMPTITNYEPVKSHARQKDHGEEVWWYYLYGDDPPLPNPILMSHPALEARITPWLAWAERVDGLLHYSATDWSDNPWQTPNVTGQDNGDAFFFYPPRKDGGNLQSCGQNGHRLVPSIRWENLRDGMEDYEYLWLLNGGQKPQVGVPNAADALMAGLVLSRTRFSLVPTDLKQTRAALAAALQQPRITAAPATLLPLLLVLGCWRLKLFGGFASRKKQCSGGRVQV